MASSFHKNGSSEIHACFMQEIRTQEDNFAEEYQILDRTNVPFAASLPPHHPQTVKLLWMMPVQLYVLYCTLVMCL